MLKLVHNADDYLREDRTEGSLTSLKKKLNQANASPAAEKENPFATEKTTRIIYHHRTLT